MISEDSAFSFQGHLFSETRRDNGEERESHRRRNGGAADAYGYAAPAKVGKNFVLDTNVLLHDPGCLQRFGDNHVCVPLDVLTELDNFKNEQTERGANARAVHRTLARMSGAGKTLTSGVATHGGGTLRLVVYNPARPGRSARSLADLERILPDTERMDHRILGCTLQVRGHNAAPTILVTKDLNLQLRACAIGLECQDYHNDKVSSGELARTGLREIEVSPGELQSFADKGALQGERSPGLAGAREYVLLRGGEKSTMPARHDGSGAFRRLEIPVALRVRHGASIRPLNLGQKCFLDALLDPSLSLVTCFGKAGTGKTLLALAAGLTQVQGRKYCGLTVSRPVVAMGDTLGFLPGTLEEKMRPWLQPVFDTLEFLTRRPETANRKGKHPPAPEAAAGSKAYENLIELGAIEVEALCYIRGRSIPNRLFILDEAQQITPLEAKTIVTRMAHGSKLVMLGDVNQIDNPYVDSLSNGLAYTRDRMRREPFVAHVVLEKGERSSLAEAAAGRM